MQMMEVGQQEAASLRGVQRLAGAILIQAIEDINHGSGKRRDEAIRWMQDSGEEHFSFIFCCRILNRNPVEVRNFVEKRGLLDWLSQAGLLTVATAISPT